MVARDSKQRPSSEGSGIDGDRLGAALRASQEDGVETAWDKREIKAKLFGTRSPPRRIGRFDVVARIGQGGMGQVFAAHDDRLDRRVAIKLMHAEASEHGEGRFAREGRALARLSHPNIVQVHEVGQHEGALFIAMEHVEGGTLGEWVAEGRSWAEIVRAYLEAGRGLAAAHSVGMVHRDFKPANAMVGVDGRVRVLDFGLARSTPTTVDTRGSGQAADRAHDELTPTVQGEGGLERVTGTGAVLGTPVYMAPEQHEGREATPASDQFAYCVALYEALHGVRPFAGHNRFAILDAIVQGRLQAPARATRVPRRVLAAVRRGLALEPTERWPSMDALLEELAAVFRTKRLRLLGAGVLLGLVPALGVSAAWLRTDDEGSPCARLGEQARGVLPGIWDDERKAVLAKAFDRSGAVFAERSWSVVKEGVDRWAQSLGEGRHAACVAHHVRREQSAETMDLRMACLDRQQRTLEALGEVFAAADATVVEHAPEAMLGLPRVDACADVERLRQGMEAPEPNAADEVRRAREELERARARLWTGRHDDGLREARHALDRAERVGYRPVASEARAVLGELELKTGKHAHGIASLERAARDALRDEHDELAAATWAMLARFAAGRLQSLESGRRWLLDADVLYERLGRNDDDEFMMALLWSEANLDRLASALPEAESKLRRVVDALARDLPDQGGDPRMRLRLAFALDDLANVLHDRGRYDQSASLHARALEQHVALLGPRHPATGASEYRLATALRDDDRPREAFAHYERALAGLGQASIEAARVHVGLAGLHHDEGRLSEATEHAERAREIFTTALPADHPEQALVLNTLGVLYFSRGALEQSVAAYEQALAIYERAYGPDHADLALTSSNLGESLVGLGRFEDALPLFEHADQLLVRDKGDRDSERAYPLKGRGLALLGLGRPTPAAIALRLAWELCPQTVPTERGEIALGLALALDNQAEARMFAQEARRLLSDEAGTLRMNGLLDTLGAVAAPFETL